MNGQPIETDFAMWEPAPLRPVPLAAEANHHGTAFKVRIESVSPVYDFLVGRGFSRPSRRPGGPPTAESFHQPDTIA